MNSTTVGESYEGDIACADACDDNDPHVECAVVKFVGVVARFDEAEQCVYLVRVRNAGRQCLRFPRFWVSLSLWVCEFCST